MKKKKKKSIGIMAFNLWTKVRPRDTRIENQNRAADEVNKKQKERLCGVNVIYIKVSTMVPDIYCVPYKWLTQ